MILNARMYSPTPALARRWRGFLEVLARRAGDPALTVVDHPPPSPLGPLWDRPDKAAVFMCGLPFSLSATPPLVVAAPLPSPRRYRGLAVYWSDVVVRARSTMHTLEDTYGGRVALTTAHSQSGFHALLQHLAAAGAPPPPYREAVGPTITFLRNLQCVVEGEADVAPIDSLGLDLLRRHRPRLARQVRVVARTAAMPIPLLVASHPHASLREALLGAHEDPACRALMRPLLLSRFITARSDDYRVLARAHQEGTTWWQTHPFLARGNEALGFRGNGTLAS